MSFNPFGATAEDEYAAPRQTHAAPAHAAAHPANHGDAARDVAPYQGPEFDSEQFLGAFWHADTKQHTDQGLEALKRALATSNNYLGEMAAIFKERIALEEVYAKGMHKLAAKTAKLQDATPGTLASAFGKFTQEMQSHSDVHQVIASGLKKCLMDPITKLKDDQKKDHKTAQAPVEKAFRQMTEARSTFSRAQRQAHNKLRDTEVAAVAMDDANVGKGGKIYTDKDKAKLAAAYEKAIKSANKEDKAMRAALEESVRATEDWEERLIVGCTEMQRMEEHRIAQLRTMLTDFAQVLTGQLPTYERAFAECLASAQVIDEVADRKRIALDHGTGKFICIRPIYEAFEENLQSGTMHEQRRQQWLRRKIETWKDELSKTHKTRTGLAKLFEASSALHIQRMEHHLDDVLKVKRQLLATDYRLAANYVTVHKLRGALSQSCAQTRPKCDLEMHVTRAAEKGMMTSSMRLPSDYVVNIDEAHRQFEEAAGVDNLCSLDRPAAASLAVQQQSPQSGSSPRAPRHSAPAAPAPPPPPPPAPHTPQHVLQTMMSSDDLDNEDEDDDDFDDEDEPAVVCQCRALYPYTPTASDELALAEGDILDVFDNSDETWWQGRLNGRAGVFPAAYVQAM